MTDGLRQFDGSDNCLRTFSHDQSILHCGTIVVKIFSLNFSLLFFVGAKRSASGSELMYARQKMVAVCKAFKAQAIDMVHIDFKGIQYSYNSHHFCFGKVDTCN